MTDKLTTEPWEMKEDETGHFRIYGGDKLICTVGNAELPSEAQNEWRANANMILSAKDMAVALEKILKRMPDDEEIVFIAKYALAKARGSNA